MKQPLCAALMLLLAACSSPPTLYWPARRDHPPTHAVAILQAWPDDRRVVPIGAIAAEASQDGLAEILDRAMSLGADAVVVGLPRAPDEAEAAIGGKQVSLPQRAASGQRSGGKVRAVLLRYLDRPASD